jgi:hypothetical protein
MLKFFTSLSFLYLLAITALVVYGLLYYRDFVRSARQRKRFPIIFSIVGIACFAFLWTNIHAPLRLKTFSNLEHHFIRHDGFIVSREIELGGSDTANFDNNPFNSFLLSKKNHEVTVLSNYSEEPFYTGAEGRFELLSKGWTATDHTVSFNYDSVSSRISAKGDNSFELNINREVISLSRQLKKGISLWNLFKDEASFINSVHYNDEQLVNCLKNILIVRDNVSGKTGGNLVYFISGKIFQHVSNVHYDQQKLQLKDLHFTARIADKNLFAWGVGFFENNKNQFRLENRGGDSFAVINRYPVSYPLSEQNDNDWSEHTINKFLVSDSRQIPAIPAVFDEGFLFPALVKDNVTGFSPVLLSYRKAAENRPLELSVQRLNNSSLIDTRNDRLILPARSSGFSWLFSIRNTFNWEFGNRIMEAGTWQWILFGSLFFFFAIVLIVSLLTPAEKLSWAWQLLSCITIVLLTTRLFLYWRYKSFPPYEGMDLPSQQQLNSFWNFGIIVFACILLAFIFGFSLVRRGLAAGRYRSSAFQRMLRGDRMAVSYETIGNSLNGASMVRRFGAKMVFFVSWFGLLATAAGLAYVNHFDPGACRHLAIGLVIIYFVFVFISYKNSPLVTSATNSWWTLSTEKKLDLVISNPVKVLLSISLLAVFVFIDIGFAIVFLNFLLFNEAFLCINYAIAGLSAGSRRNAATFGSLGFIYLAAFVLNLLYAPYIFKFLLSLPQSIYIAGYVLFSIVIAYNLARLFTRFSYRRKIWSGMVTSLLFFFTALFFFPKQKILDKAAMTKYRIDVMTMPVDEAIKGAYNDGKTYEPVIRAAQNQWFINTLIYEGNNPAVQGTGFHLVPHAPQNKGAKYNAQATDLVASRFFLAEHGKWSVLLFVLLLILPVSMLGSFYKLYPDFINRTNTSYPTITAGFSIMNYFLISALLVILAATGRYIFFGQDMPFGSILSKQSILFPSILIAITILLFSNAPLEYYANRRKFIPGAIVFGILAVLLFFVKPSFNKNKEFNAGELAGEMDTYVQLRLQPILDHFDTSKRTGRYSLTKKDKLFTDSLRRLVSSGIFNDDNPFFRKQVEEYTRSGFLQHLDQTRMLYLDLYSGRPQLAVNDNYFRVEPPPHLQQSWKGNVFGDSSIYNITLWNNKDRSLIRKRLTGFTNEPVVRLTSELSLLFASAGPDKIYKDLYLINNGHSVITISDYLDPFPVRPGDSVKLCNPSKLLVTDSTQEIILITEPDAFMKNYYVNGSRFYVYPLASRFIWARNFAESIASGYTVNDQIRSNAAVSLDFELMDSLSQKIQAMMNRDTAYKKGAEYGICIADGNGRLVAMSDFIKGLNRPDPNDKPGYNKTIMGENGYVSQSLLRKQIGNINLLRMNPGPGSTFKPIVFSAIASQLDLDWDNFSSEGFSIPQHYYGGEKVAEYDFEKNNGRIADVADYLKYSDNYYHSNVLLLGSYPKQELNSLLMKNFLKQKPDSGFQWPWFNYNGQRFWLDGYENWPGYINGKANFGMDSSFTSIGLLDNYGIYNRPADKSFDMFSSHYDSLLFVDSYKKSGFILPECALFDQQGANVNKRIPYDVFATCFRGHVKGSSQVMVPPAKMVEAFGKLITQSRDYALTLNPYARPATFSPFRVDQAIAYNRYLSLMREGVFTGMKDVLYSGTAAALGALLKNRSTYFYYAKTGTTGDNEAKTKSKLFAIIISKRDVTDPGFNFRNNKFYTIYFTSQNGPAKQNEQFQNEIIRFIERSYSFNKYMQ